MGKQDKLVYLLPYHARDELAHGMFAGSTYSFLIKTGESYQPQDSDQWLGVINGWAYWVEIKE